MHGLNIKRFLIKFGSLLLKSHLAVVFTFNIAHIPDSKLGYIFIDIYRHTIKSFGNARLQCAQAHYKVCRNQHSVLGPFRVTAVLVWSLARLVHGLLSKFLPARVLGLLWPYYMLPFSFCFFLLPSNKIAQTPAWSK